MRRLSLVAVICAALASSACGQGGGPVASVVDAVAATVDDTRIDRSDFERELTALADNKLLGEGGPGLLGKGEHTISARISSGWLTAVIYDRLITAEIARRELTITDADRERAEVQLAQQFGDPAVAEAFPDWFRALLIGRNVRAASLRDAVSGVDLSEAGLQAYYDEHPEDFGRVCLSHLLVPTEDEANAALARVAAGETFAAVATAVSTDQGSAPKGGDLDCNARGTFVPEFDAAAFAAELGVPTAPVKTQFGFHVLLVRERPVSPFGEAKEEIEALLRQKVQTVYTGFLAELAKKADIVVDPRYGTFESAEGGSAEVVPPTPPAPADGRGGTVGGAEPVLGGPGGGIPPPAPGSPAPGEAPAGQPPPGG